MNNNKKWFKKWWVWVLIVLVVGILGNAMTAANTKTATTSYEVPGHNTGDATGNIVELDNGNFTTANIKAGTYNVSNIGTFDMITTTNPMKLISGTSAGTFEGLVIKDETTVEILNQSNQLMSDDASPIIFTEVYTDTAPAKTVTEKIEITTEAETCYIDNTKTDCTKLKNYESLKTEATNK